MKKTFTALTTKTIEIPGTEHSIPKDTDILVDPSNGIGFWNNHHFDIFPDEYCLLN